MSATRTLLLLVAAGSSAARVLPLPAVAPPSPIGWMRPQHHHQHCVGPIQHPLPLPTHTAFLWPHGYVAPVPRPPITWIWPAHTGIIAASDVMVAKSQQTKPTTTTATTSSAVVPTTATDTTTRKSGLLSFINAPPIPCPDGQRRDPEGNCRDEW